MTLADAENLLASLASATATQELIAELAGAQQTPDIRLLAVRVMARVMPKTPPASWAERVAAAVADESKPLREAALAAASALRDRKVTSPALTASLTKLAAQPGANADDRLAALAALAALPDPLRPADEDTFALLTARLAPGESIFSRRSAIATLRRLPLADSQWLALARSAGNLEPAGLAEVLGLFERCPSEAAGRELLDRLRAAKGVANLPVDTLRKAFAKQPEAMREDAAKLSANQGIDPAKQRARLDELAAALKTGDVRRGQEVFRGMKTGCTACHAMGYVGGNIGPDLTRIGKIRTERDLLEAIIYPSASFVRSYEPMLVHTKSGDLLGIVRAENADELVLAVGPGAEMHVPRADTQGIEPAPTSLMPPGYDGILTLQELADLVTFLKASI